MEFLKTEKIPVSAVNIGPVHKKDVFRASIQLERDRKYAIILAFDVPVDREAQVKHSLNLLNKFQLATCKQRRHSYLHC